MPSGVYVRTEEMKKKISDGSKGKTLSKEHKRKMSESQKGRILSEETKKKISNSGKGRIFTEEHKKKLSLSLGGRTLSEEHKRKMSLSKIGENHPMFGKPVSEETRRKIGDGNKGKIISEETRKKISNSMKGEKNHFYGKKHTDKMKERMMGEKNHLWKGGTSFFPYCEKFNNQRKRAVREFFDNKCICCGNKQHHQKLSVHHIDHDKDQGCSGKPFNLVPLCRNCHSKELHYEEEYKKYINHTLEEGFKWGIWNEEEYKEKVMY